MSQTPTMVALGLMSGTSMDGIDIALIETDGAGIVRRGPSRTHAYDANFRSRLEQGLEAAKTIRQRDDRPGTLAALERDVTDRHAEAVLAFLNETNTDLAKVDVVGFHGQTVLHRPQDRLTVQIGSGQRLADRLGRTVVFDMRATDIVNGGQGAPLIPAYHAALPTTLPDGLPTYPIAFVNIGGISNITYIDGQSDPIAFDTGPGNALIDQWVSREAGMPFDRNGSIANRGVVIDALAQHYLAAEFFRQPAPKSLDRFDFAVPPSGGPLNDVARTLCFVAAQAILRAVDHLPAPPKLWIVGGGGRKHPAIMEDLRRGATRYQAQVISAEDAGLDGDTLESEAWAYLAVRSLRGLPLTFPTTTGCRSATTGGVIAMPNAATAVA